MFFAFILLLSALSISAVAAYYSIAGLTAIFAAAFWPIVIMGSVLEVGKIMTTVWLHVYWKRIPLLDKNVSVVCSVSSYVCYFNGDFWISIESTH